MQDLLGRELNLGDRVAYPTHDRSMRSQMVVGTLVGLKLRPKRVRRQRANWLPTDSYMNRYEWVTIQVPKAYIKTEVRANPGWGQSALGGATVVIEKVDNLVKVA